VKFLNASEDREIACMHQSPVVGAHGARPHDPRPRRR
jgi:hypothetical protein